MKTSENIALNIIVLAMVTTIVLMLIDDFGGSTEYDGDVEGKTPYELYPDAWENSSFNPENGYLYYQGINYEDK
tara:strand:+ start:60595 stop:60816 length:222 start_codon:yes stop_codon:yes gene_type:complete